MTIVITEQGNKKRALKMKTTQAQISGTPFMDLLYLIKIREIL